MRGRLRGRDTALRSAAAAMTAPSRALPDAAWPRAGSSSIRPDQGLRQTDERRRRTRGDGDRRSQARRSRHRARFCQPRVGGRRPLPQLRSGRARRGRPDPCGRRPRGRAPCRSGPRGPSRAARTLGQSTLGPLRCLVNNASTFERDGCARCHAGIVGSAPGEQSARPVRADPAFRPTAGAGGRGQRDQHHRRARLEPDPPFPLVHAQQGRAVDTDPNAGASARADDPHQCNRAGTHPARASISRRRASIACARRCLCGAALRPKRSAGRCTSSWRRPP